jgi:hypothetical protein
MHKWVENKAYLLIIGISVFNLEYEILICTWGRVGHNPCRGKTAEGAG